MICTHCGEEFTPPADEDLRGTADLCPECYELFLEIDP